MALYHLSGDEIGASKKKQAKKQAKKETKAKKKADKKTKPKKVAKVGLAPARASTIAVVELNLLKLATKLARVWKAPGGKTKLLATWKKFGGDPAHLQKAIAKGSKQTIGAQMGVVGATAIATATPIIIVLAKLISEFKAGGDDTEKKEFDQGVDQGVKDLANDPNVDKGDQNMPEGSDVALVKPKSGGDGGETPLGLNTNPISISFFILMMLFALRLTNPILVAISTPFALYAVIGFIVIPFSEFGIAGEKVKHISRKYFDVPARYFNSIINLFSHGKA